MPCYTYMYYQARGKHLKESKPSAWWKEVKKLSSLSPGFVSRDSISKPLQQLYGTPDETSLANIIKLTRPFFRQFLVSLLYRLITSAISPKTWPVIQSLLYTKKKTTQINICVQNPSPPSYRRYIAEEFVIDIVT